MQILHIISVASLIVAAASFLIILVDIGGGHRQKMPVMNWVWPITGLWAGPIGLWAYFAFGRVSAPSRPGQSRGGMNRHEHESQSGKSEKDIEHKVGKPFWQIVAVGTTHCAAGCTLGDVAGEWIVFLTGFTIAGSMLLTDYLVDFVLAYLGGIVFQYFAIAPMRGLSGWPALQAAVKADTVSLVAFEIGMFAWMALVHEVLFTPSLVPNRPEYWFMMQIAMLVGFLTSYPANWWLIRRGIKEAM
jgi:hypothetical protein